MKQMLKIEGGNTKTAIKDIIKLIKACDKYGAEQETVRLCLTAVIRSTSPVVNVSDCVFTGKV